MTLDDDRSRMADEHLSELYQEIILGHNRRPKNEGILDPNDGMAEGYNPLCGDEVAVYFRQNEDGVLSEVTFSGEGCAISRASASIMTTAVKGKSADEVGEVIARVVGMLTAKDEPVVELSEWGDLAALVGVRKFPARIKCATLAWHALAEAVSKKLKS